MKRFTVKKIYFFFSSLFIFMLHLPFVFAKVKPAGIKAAKVTIPQSVELVDIKTANTNTDAMYRSGLYDSLCLGAMGLARQGFNYAMQGFNHMKQLGEVKNSNILSIVDFSRPSSEKRLFIIDLKNCKVLFNTYVAHGLNSGKEFARYFSNRPESNQSSLGFYETLETYSGSNGYSLRLRGMENGINDNAGKRAIVMHGADYVNEKLARLKGCIGRSWGCPAVPVRLHKPIIDKIKNGTCLFIYSSDRNYLSQSRLINHDYFLNNI